MSLIVYAIATSMPDQQFHKNFFVTAEELAKEPPDGRFPDWLNLRVQRPKAAAAAAAAARKRAGRRGKKETRQPEVEDTQPFQVSRWTRLFTSVRIVLKQILQKWFSLSGHF